MKYKPVLPWKVARRYNLPSRVVYLNADFGFYFERRDPRDTVRVLRNAQQLLYPVKLTRSGWYAQKAEDERYIAHPIPQHISKIRDLLQFIETELLEPLEFLALQESMR